MHNRCKLMQTNPTPMQSRRREGSITYHGWPSNEPGLFIRSDTVAVVHCVAVITENLYNPCGCLTVHLDLVVDCECSYLGRDSLVSM